MLPLAGLLVAVFIDLFGLGVIRPILPLYAQEVFGVDVLRVSWIPAAFGIGKLLADVPAGLLMDNLGRQRLMAVGLVLVATVDLLSAAESAFPRFLLWRSLAGLGFGLFATTAATIVLDLAPSRARGRLMGSYLLVGDVGAVFGAGAGGWIYERLGTRAPFVLKALCAGTAGVLAGRIRSGWAAHERRAQAGLRAAIGLPGLVSISLVSMTLFMADVGILATLFPLFLHSRGLAPGVIGLVVALVVAVQVGALALGSRLADRLGRVRILLLGLGLYAIGLALLSIVRSSAPTLSVAILMAVGSGLARAIPAAVVGDLAEPPLRGAAMGVFRTFTDIGMIGGPGLLGALAGKSYPFAFLAAAGFLIVNMAMLIPAQNRFIVAEDRKART